MSQGNKLATVGEQPIRMGDGSIYRKWSLARREGRGGERTLEMRRLELSIPSTEGGTHGLCCINNSDVLLRDFLKGDGGDKFSHFSLNLKHKIPFFAMLHDDYRCLVLSTVCLQVVMTGRGGYYIRLLLRRKLSAPLSLFMTRNG